MDLNGLRAYIQPRHGIVSIREHFYFCTSVDDGVFGQIINNIEIGNYRHRDLWSNNPGNFLPQVKSGEDVDRVMNFSQVDQRLIQAASFTSVADLLNGLKKPLS